MTLLPKEKEIAARLLHMLDGGYLKAGSALPAIRDLSEMFGCGRKLVTNAIRALVEAGVLRQLDSDRFIVCTEDYFDRMRTAIIDLLLQHGGTLRSVTIELARDDGPVSVVIDVNAESVGGSSAASSSLKR